MRGSVTILAYLSPAPLARLQAANVRDLLVARSWAAVRDYLETRKFDCVILDPMADGSNNVRFLRMVLEQYQPLPLIAYVELSTDSVRVLAELSASGRYRALVYPTDGKLQIEMEISRAQNSSLMGTFLSSLEVIMTELPARLRATILNMLSEPQKYSTVLELSLGSQVALSSLYRTFHNVGLGPPRNLVIAAKMLRFYISLTADHLPVQLISQKLGYANLHTLHENCLETFGVAPSLVRSFTQVSALESLLRLVYPKSHRFRSNRNLHLQIPVRESTLT